MANSLTVRLTYALISVKVDTVITEEDVALTSVHFSQFCGCICNCAIIINSGFRRGVNEIFLLLGCHAA